MSDTFTAKVSTSRACLKCECGSFRFKPAGINRLECQKCGQVFQQIPAQWVAENDHFSDVGKKVKKENK